MRWTFAWCALTWLLVVGAGACGGKKGYGVGEACDPNVGGRDCEEGLDCTYNYDDCPTYGCPKCTRTCRTDADCPASDTDSCSKPPHCQHQQRTDFVGVCDHCDTIKPWFPP